MIRRRLLGIAGAFAAAGLMLAPGNASAALDKCSKEVSKNSGKLSADVQKGLQKCVDGWLKEEGKVAANLDKGKTIEGGAAKTLPKAAAKCQKEIEKLFGSGPVPGSGIAANISDAGAAKSKLGKTHVKLTDVITKNKCLAGELTQLGHEEDLNLMSRLMLASGVNDGYSTQIATNEAAMTAFDDMGANRCAVTGVACVDVSDCNGLDPADLCNLAPCPDCQIFGRAKVSDETSPQAGNYAGPCSRSTCSIDGGSSAITNYNTGGIIPTVPVTLDGNLSVEVCDLPSVLPGALSLHGGPDSSLSADLFGTPVCLKTTRSAGWLTTNSAVSPPSKTTAACSDHDVVTSDECAAFAANTCTDSQYGGKTCIASTDVAAANGDIFMRAAQRITVILGTAGPDAAPCTADDWEAPGAIAPTLLTSRTAQADLYDGGKLGNPGTTNLSTGVLAGAVFDVGPTGIQAGALTGGTLAGAFSSISDSALLGDSVTGVAIVCQ